MIVDSLGSGICKATPYKAVVTGSYENQSFFINIPGPVSCYNHFSFRRTRWQKTRMHHMPENTTSGSNR